MWADCLVLALLAYIGRADLKYERIKVEGVSTDFLKLEYSAAFPAKAVASHVATRKPEKMRQKSQKMGKPEKPEKMSQKPGKAQKPENHAPWEMPEKPEQMRSIPFAERERAFLETVYDEVLKNFKDEFNLVDPLDDPHTIAKARLDLATYVAVLGAKSSYLGDSITGDYAHNRPQFVKRDEIIEICSIAWNRTASFAAAAKAADGDWVEKVWRDLVRFPGIEKVLESLLVQASKRAVLTQLLYLAVFLPIQFYTEDSDVLYKWSEHSRELFDFRSGAVWDIEGNSSQYLKTFNLSTPSTSPLQAEQKIARTLRFTICVTRAIALVNHVPALESLTSWFTDPFEERGFLYRCLRFGEKGWRGAFQRQVEIRPKIDSWGSTLRGEYLVDDYYMDKLAAKCSVLLITKRPKRSDRHLKDVDMFMLPVRTVSTVAREDEIVVAPGVVYKYDRILRCDLDDEEQERHRKEIQSEDIEAFTRGLDFGRHRPVQFDVKNEFAKVQIQLQQFKIHAVLAKFAEEMKLMNTCAGQENRAARRAAMDFWRDALPGLLADDEDEDEDILEDEDEDILEDEDEYEDEDWHRSF